MENITITEITPEGGANNQTFTAPLNHHNDNAIPGVTDVEEVVKSKNFIGNFMDYVKSSAFMSKCEEAGKRTGVPPKKVARNFFENILGTIGDVLGVVISTGKDLLLTTIEVLGVVLKAGVSIICGVASAVVRVITLNKTVMG
jgi:hypothetical protein